MASVQNVFGATSVKEFDHLITLCGWKIKKQDNINIICWQQGAKTDIRPSVKGLIYDNIDGNILAPGVPMPLESEPAYKPVSYTRALDGVTFRFWYSKTLGRFTWSTNGMITAGKWLCADLNAIMEDCIREKDLVDLDILNPDYCYMAILECPQIPNMYYVENPILTLVRILDKKCVEIPLKEAVGFKSVISFYEHSQLASMNINRDIVVTRDTFGELAHYANGETYRFLTDNAKAAEHFRPNYSEVWQHWIYHARDTTPDMWEYGAIAWYKLFFPWNTQVIDGLCNYFTETVPPPEYEEILQSTTSMKRIVDNYLKDVVVA